MRHLPSSTVDSSAVENKSRTRGWWWPLVPLLVLLIGPLHGCQSSTPKPVVDLTPEAGPTGMEAGPTGDDSGSTLTDAEAGSSTDGSQPTGPCSALPGTLVYIESGDTQENLLKRIGRHLRDNANITLVFSLTGSCTLTSDLYLGNSIAGNATLKYIPSTAENPGWTTAQPEATCTTDPGGAAIDVGISALFVQSCGDGVPEAGSGLALIQGPIQAYTFVVPTASSQTAIWAAEAYYAFGFGDGNPLGPPWNNQQFMFIRPTTKSTLVATAFNIDLPADDWLGVQEPASSDVVNAVTTSTNPEATIGILGAEVYDGDRGNNIKTLAFQAYTQNGAYYPDSTATAFDKQNLRDGHYPLWSPTVYITQVDGNGVPTNPAVKYLTDLVLGAPGATPPDGGTPFDGLADVVGVGLIPQCAMKVTRSADGGPLSLVSQSVASCNCYYLSQVPGATGTPAGCTTCAVDADCGATGSCQHGFCEPDMTASAYSGDGGNGCFAGTPTTNTQIVNACTNAPSIAKSVTLPTPAADGGLEPPP
jgi:hypothetical protein